MKKGMIISVVLLSVVFLFGCGQNQSSQAQTSSINDSLAVNKINTDNKSVNEKASVVYLSFNGTATDDGNITGKNTNEEFYLFMKNDENNVVYVISKQNYDLWSSKKIMPAQLMPGMQTYKADIASSKKLENADNTVEYYEITKLNSMVETDEIN